MLYTLVILLNACTPVISSQLMDWVDRNMTYRFLASQPDELSILIRAIRIKSHVEKAPKISPKNRNLKGQDDYSGGQEMMVSRIRFPDGRQQVFQNTSLVKITPCTALSQFFAIPAIIMSGHPHRFHMWKPKARYFQRHIYMHHFRPYHYPKRQRHIPNKECMQMGETHEKAQARQFWN